MTLPCLWPLSLVLVCCLSATFVAAGPPKADLVLRNGIVYTAQEGRPATGEALAVTGARISAVGTSQALARLIGPKTRVVDLEGRAVVPGFEDSHAHVLQLGFARIDIDLTKARTYGELVDLVAAAVRDRKPGEWVRGRGWHESKWTEAPADGVRGFPRHEALSAVSPDNPVRLERADGHAVLVNAKALEQMGITADTPAPAGGEIIRDDEGRATGVFVDNAQSLIRPPDRTVDENRRALDLAMEEALAKGVTTLTDAGAKPEAVALYREYAAAGKLGVRLYVMASGLADLKEWKEPRVGLGGGFLTLRAVKLYADGAMGSRGAALLEPYDDDPGNSGLLVTPSEDILETARWALPRGFQVATHAIGDRANRIVLDQYETAFREFPGVKDHRFRIEHAQLLDEADIPRFGRLHVIASMQGIHAPSDRPWAPARVGMARVTEGLYVWRKLWQTGALIVNGTDAPVEDLSPILNFHASVTRMNRDGRPPGGFDPDQRMTREEALRTYTKDAAFAQFEEKDKGTLEVGKRADFVVLSRDIMTVPESEIPGAEVDLTVVDGRVRFERAAAAR